MDPTWSATQSVAEKPVESALPSMITLSEIQRDRLTKIAEDNWSKAAGGGGGGKDSGGERWFNPELVKEIYKTELLVKGGRKPILEGDDFGGDSVFGELPLAQFGPRCGVVRARHIDDSHGQ